MKRLIPLLLLASFSTTGMAQATSGLTAPLNNLQGALTTLVGGFQAGGIALANGDVTNFFRNNNTAFISFNNQLTDGTPAEPLGTVANELSQTGFDALLPVYQTLDGPAMQLADAGAPVLVPVQGIIQSAVIDPGFDTFGDGVSTGNNSGLSLASLPLSAEALDPATLTQLLDGASLPGLQ